MILLLCLVARADPSFDGYRWIAQQLNSPESVREMGVDSVSLFAEVAETAVEPELRAWSGDQARHNAQVLADEVLARPLLWEGNEALDGLELVTHMDALGLPTDAVWNKVRLSLRIHGSPQALCGHGAGALNADQAYDLLMCGYVAERGLAWWPEPPVRLHEVLPGLRRLWAQLAASLPSRDVAYLATHHVLVVTDYGRKEMAEDESALRGYLEATWPAVLASGDVELIGEYVDGFGLLGLDELQNDGRQWIRERQLPSGAWPSPAAQSLYGRIHPTWCGAVALLERVTP